MGLKVNAGQWASNWAAGYSAAGAKMSKGADDLQVAPGVSATDPDVEQKMKNKWLAAYNSGKWHNATVSVSLADWRNAYKSKGIPNAQNSIPLAKVEVSNYAQKAIPVYNSILQNIDAMPKVTLQDSIARAAAWMTQLQAAADAGQLS